MVKVITIIGGIVVIAALGWLIFSQSDSRQSGMTGMISAKAPDFSLKDYEGKTVSLPDFHGKPLVINSWAAWCPFCVEELADFARAQEEFGDKVAVIAVDRAESLETAKSFSDKYGVTGRMTLLLDPSDSFYKSIGGFAMPETIFVNSEGNVVYHKRGPMKLDEIRRRIQEML